LNKIDVVVDEELDFEIGDSVIVIKEDGTIRKVILPEMGIGTTKTAGYKKTLKVIDMLKRGAKKDFIQHNRKKLH